MILGIDPSLTGTGICLMEDTDDFKTKTITTGELRGVNRLKFIKDQVDLILERNVDIDKIFIENYSYGSVGMTYQLGELGGILRLLFNSYDIPFEVVSIGTWKKEVCGKGNYNKDRVRLEVETQYGHEFDSQDECDSWAIAEFGRRKEHEED